MTSNPAKSSLRILLFFTLGVETAIYRLDKHVRCPRGISAEARVVVPGQFRRLDLRKRHAALDHLPYAITDDGHHVAVVRNVSRIGDPAVSGNDYRSAFHHVLHHGHIE